MLQWRFEQSTILLRLNDVFCRIKGPLLFIRVDARFLLLVYVQSSAPFWPVRGFLQTCRYLIGFIANDKVLYEFDLHCSFL